MGQPSYVHFKHGIPHKTLCRCSTGADPVTDPTTLGSVVKVLGSYKKGCENGESVKKSLTGHYSYREDVMTTLTGRRVGDIYCTASSRSSMTSPNRQAASQTDKP